jgi:hypothetical protein
MSPKFVLILYYLLPFAAFGQTLVSYRPSIESTPSGLVYYSENNAFLPGSLHFPGARNYVYNSYQYNSGFPVSGDPTRQDGEGFPQYGDDYSRPLGWKETFGQPIYREPISLKGMIRRDDNKMGASATGGLVYTGGDDVFAYAHYGRTGKLIWRTSPSPIANNMMATRWSLANFNIFRRASLTSISDQLR